MARGVGRPDHANNPNKARPGGNDSEIRDKATELLEDGALSTEDIEALAADVGKLKHPRKRAFETKALRRMIRESDLSEADKREAIRALNKALAGKRPAWAKPFAGSDAVEDQKTTTESTQREQLIRAVPSGDTSLEAPPTTFGLGARKL